MNSFDIVKAARDTKNGLGILADTLRQNDRRLQAAHPEATLREDRRLRRLLETAKLKENARVEDIDFRRAWPRSSGNGVVGAV